MGDIFLFEGFRFDQQGGGLFRETDDGTLASVAVGSRALDLLGVLVGRAGDLVSKRQIMEAVWPGVVVEAGNLTVQISSLRRVLDQGRSEGTCIQTIPGRGYRFVTAVTRRDRAAPPNSMALAAPGGRAPPRLSIVVLPFTNLSDDREQQFFADGLTEDLTTDLSRLPDMFVISRNTAFTYRNKRADTTQIGRELGVRYMLEGSVRRSGDRVRVNAQLIDTETDVHLWAERFDGHTGNLLAFQDEITSRIAVALDLELIGAEAARPTDHPDVLDYIFRAHAAGSKPSSRVSYMEGISLLEHAVALDPQSIQAQSRLASALASRVLDGLAGSPATDIMIAEGLVQRALAASAHSSLAHFAKGQVLRAQHRSEEPFSNTRWPSHLIATGQLPTRNSAAASSTQVR
jgi:TolB-like protein